FVEYDLMNICEFDQALARRLAACGPDNSSFCEDEIVNYSNAALNKVISYVVDFLSSVMLDEYKYCTVYDFIHTIEMLNKMNDDPRIFEFFKNIEGKIMKFSEQLDQDFENAVAAELVGPADRNVYKGTINIRAAFRSAWQHFVVNDGAYKYAKIDILAKFAANRLYQCLNESLEFLVQAYSNQQYLFYLFYCRFITKILDCISDTAENKLIIWAFVELLAPEVIPSFTAQYLEILKHEYLGKYLERPEAWFIFKNIIRLLKYNREYELCITDFFQRKNFYTKRYNLYLSFLCPEYCVALKNLFNCLRIKKEIDRNGNEFFGAYYNLYRGTAEIYSYAVLIDHLNENGVITNAAIQELNSMIDRNERVSEIVLSLILRSRGANVPQGITSAVNTILKRDDLKETVKKYNELFNK
ncbi:hypothetical protein ENBRE01_0819, partial [Enteropsectra breve]